MSMLSTLGRRLVATGRRLRKFATFPSRAERANSHAFHLLGKRLRRIDAGEFFPTSGSAESRAFAKNTRRGERVQELWTKRNARANWATAGGLSIMPTLLAGRAALGHYRSRRKRGRS